MRRGRVGGLSSTRVYQGPQPRASGGGGGATLRRRVVGLGRVGFGAGEGVGMGQGAGMGGKAAGMARECPRGMRKAATALRRGEAKRSVGSVAAGGCGCGWGLMGGAPRYYYTLDLM